MRKDWVAVSNRRGRSDWVVTQKKNPDLGMKTKSGIKNSLKN